MRGRRERFKGRGSCGKRLPPRPSLPWPGAPDRRLRAAVSIARPPCDLAHARIEKRGDVRLKPHCADESEGGYLRLRESLVKPHGGSQRRAALVTPSSTSMMRTDRVNGASFSTERLA
jgi:hypothetical protein